MGWAGGRRATCFWKILPDWAQKTDPKYGDGESSQGGCAWTELSRTETRKQARPRSLQARNGPGIVGRGLGGWGHCGELGLTSLGCTGSDSLLRSHRV